MEQGARIVFTVSKLTAAIKKLIEDAFPFVWLTGEISNFTVASSGHFYFTLKDDNAQIQAVMFKGQNRVLKFRPENGMSVTGLGRISLYEPRGAYQIIMEVLEPKGLGGLHAAFDALKKKLFDEGLFDEEKKKPLPFLPKTIGLVTSPTGAVIRDFITIAHRRFPGIRIRLAPVRVQGKGAEDEISRAVSLLNRLDDIDVIVLARGGGSLEDLWPFNTETAARAIASSVHPVVSAIGHETDYTISDFAADLRAPTPSAAAELIIPLRQDVENEIIALDLMLKKEIQKKIEDQRTRIGQLVKQLPQPFKRVSELRLRVDDLFFRLHRMVKSRINNGREKNAYASARINSQNPLKHLARLNEKKISLDKQLCSCMKKLLDKKKDSLNLLDEKLAAMSPVSILKRGYSITRLPVTQTIVTSETQVSVGNDIEVILHEGVLSCSITDKNKGKAFMPENIETVSRRKMGNSGVSAEEE